MKGQRHLEMIGIVARGLRDLKDDVVFIGGATVGLHITDPAAPEIRLSEDVDCVIEIASRSQYYELETKLRRFGFKEPRGEDHPLCRWEYSGIIVDIMPTSEKILGFTNRWYKEGILNAKKITLAGGLEIAIFSLPYMIASKIEAFKSRGHGDYLASPDMEDIVTLLDGCVTIKDELELSDEKIKKYLNKEFYLFLKDDRFIESVRAHIDSVDPSGNRAKRALSLLKAFARL